MRKRVLSALLALCLMLSLVPTGWASGTTADPTNPPYGTCGTNVEWLFTPSTGKLRIYVTDSTKTGTIDNYTGASGPWAAYAEDITSVEIGDGVTTIGNYAFATCANLDSITIPKSVATIGSNVFLTCEKLSKVNYAGMQSEWDSITKPDDLLPDGAVVVPAGQTTTSPDSCGPNLTWTFNATAGLLTIHGSGPMTNYANDADNRPPWFSNRNNIKVVAIDAGVTSIGDYALYGCNTLTDIYYLGSADEWTLSVSTGNGNPVVGTCHMHYNRQPCIITFDPGTGAASTAKAQTEIVESDMPYQFPKDKFEPSKNPDMAFKAWVVDDDRSVEYPELFYYTITKNTTLRALWVRKDTVKKFNIKYMDAYLDPALASDYYEYYQSDKEQALLLPSPKREGYDFLGWSYLIGTEQHTSNGNETVYLPANVGQDLVFTARWQPKTYSIIVRDGIEILGRAEYTYSEEDQEIQVTVNRTTKEGYTLQGLYFVEDVGQQDKLIKAFTSGTFYIPVPKKSNTDLYLVADWGETIYNLRYEFDGGHWNPPDSSDDPTAPVEVTYTVLDTGKPMKSIGKPEKEGYIFDGWAFSGSGEVTASEDYTKIVLPKGTTGDVTLTAKWEPETYEITYDPNGGRGTMEKGTATYGQPFRLPDHGFTAPDGKKFVGWHIDDGAFNEKYEQIMLPDNAGGISGSKKTDFDIGEDIYLKSNTTIKALWKQIYKITFKPNGGTGTMPDDTSHVEGDVYKLPACGFTAPEGKVFKAWEINGVEYVPYEEDAPENTNNTYTLPPYTTGDTTIEVTAVWEDLYTITYTPGEGTGDPKTETISETKGKDYKLPEIDEFAFAPPEGMIFDGWTITVKDQDPEEMNAGDLYEVKSDITVTAQWAKDVYKVIYQPGDGTGTEKTETYDFGAKVELAECTFTAPEGKEFDYWQVDGFPTNKFKPGSTFRITEKETKVTAIWKESEYTITYKSGAGTGEDVEVEGPYKFNDTAYLWGEKDAEGRFEPPVTPADPDDPDSKDIPHVLVGWEIDGQEYALGSAYTVTGPTTATAIWEDPNNLKAFKVIYQNGGGSGEDKEVTIHTRKDTTSVTIALPKDCEFAPPEETMWFVGWGTDFAPGAAVTLTEDTTTFAARWSGKIVYENGGDATEPDHYIYGAGETLTLPTPTIPGKIFTGWTCEHDPDVVISANRWLDLPSGFKGTLTLTGHWEDDRDVYLITFDPNGGTGEMASVTVPRQEEGMPPTPYTLPACGFTAPVGMEFDCWLVGEAQFKPDDSIPIVGNTTVTAQWKKKTVPDDAEDCTVTYAPGEGTGEPITETHKVGEWLVLPDCTFTAPEGKEFDAWDKGKPGEEIYLEGDTTITALWKDKEPEPDDPSKPKVWTITFDANGGTGTMASIEVSQVEGGATYTLPACGFTAPEGKVFQGWQVGAEERNPGTTITITGDTTIKALWKDAPTKPTKPTNYKITYNLNGGYMTGSGPSSYNVSTEAQTINVPVPYKSGYTFLGWTYSGVSKPTKTITIRANMTGDLTVVANWQMEAGANPGVNGSPSQGNYIAVSTTAGGDIRIPYEYAVQNATVTFQAQPQAGFAVGTVSVKNSQGWDVGDLRDLGGGSYSFTMPNYRVNISATFVQQSAAASPIAKPLMNYDDVRLGDWYYNSVEYVYNRNMMSGVSATQFGPNGEASRGVIWTALAAHAGFDINGGSTWFERGQYWAVNRGITDGASPSAAITREQLVTMLWRYKGNPTVFGGDLSQFVDGYTVSGYAMDAMRWAVSTGLMGGANGRLNPQATTTRAEAATILARFCQNM